MAGLRQKARHKSNAGQNRSSPPPPGGTPLPAFASDGVPKGQGADCESGRKIVGEMSKKAKKAAPGPQTDTRTSQLSELYQLHLDVEAIARQLRERQRRGWAPLNKHVDALYEVQLASNS
jgi:hypothetical protein